jgi:plastocyanin
MHSSIAFLATSLALASAKTITIVGGMGGPKFSPNSTTADVGDTLEFHFIGTPHTVVQGDFNTPCHLGSSNSTGFYSGPMVNAADGSVSNSISIKIHHTQFHPDWS